MTHSIITLAADVATSEAPALSLSEEATIYDHMQVVVFGFGWVMLTLMILSMLIALVSKFFTKPEPAKKEAAAPAPQPTAAQAQPAAATTPTTEGDIPPTHLAAIAAAVYSTMGTSSRIVSIRSAQHGGWASEGRRQHFQSHRVR